MKQFDLKISERKKVWFWCKKIIGTVTPNKKITETKNLLVSGKIIDTETKRSVSITNFLKELKIKYEVLVKIINSKTKKKYLHLENELTVKNLK